jgi:hypothetical protein
MGFCSQVGRKAFEECVINRQKDFFAQIGRQRSNKASVVHFFGISRVSGSLLFQSTQSLLVFNHFASHLFWERS